MFSTFKTRILLGVYIFIILSIPVGAYLASESQIFKSKASETTPLSLKATPTKPTLSPARKLLQDAASKVASEGAVTAPANGASETLSESSSPTIANSFGPTLSFKAVLEGRPADKQNSKLFVGIYEGTLVSSPKFILSFSVDLPESGSYGNLSLAGLTVGNKYTALLKGSAQIATSSAFVMSPTVTNLNEGNAVNMLSGDLNEDNVINSADYSIVQKANGSTAKSASWNGTADLNVDGVVNIFDLSIVSKNLGQVGASGAWISPLPKVATPSGGLNSGYWIWIPK